MCSKGYDNLGQVFVSVCVFYGSLVFSGLFSLPTACPISSEHLGDSRSVRVLHCAVRFSEALPTLVDPTRSLHVVWHVTLVSAAVALHCGST